MSVVLSDDEVMALCGGLKQPARQLRALHSRGYWRAYIGKAGSVVLERAHYAAVSSGQASPAARAPKLRTPNLRTA
ncbi:MAG: DUF4224 domain-containing protein [Burkholderiaceae bacterium]|nr:DUF4224 domain-containing protein [Burkholderiaceae bacterium]